jgi:hypothetical protein
MLKYALMGGIHDHGAATSYHNYLWLALAHEKVGLHNGALRICDLGLQTELSMGATPHMWDKSAMHGCTGRVLSKLGRKTEALAAFQAGVRCSVCLIACVCLFTENDVTGCSHMHEG